MRYHSPWALTALFSTFAVFAHAASQCTKTKAPRVTIPNGGFGTGQLDPWDQYPEPSTIEKASVIHPGYRSRYAAKVTLPSIDFNAHPTEYNITENVLIQQVYDPLISGACYKITLAYNWLSYSGPAGSESSLCNLFYDVSGLGYTNKAATKRSGWHEESFYATPFQNETNFDIQATLTCLPDDETNVTPEVVLLLDFLTVTTVRYKLSPGTPVQSE